MNIFNRKGMTLIEVVLAMAIFGIIAVSFITMFSSSLLWIYRAGDRGEAYSMAQSDVERRIITGDSYETDNLTIVFGGDDTNTISIRGGIVESIQSIHDQSSSIETFIPYVPTISLDREFIFEGEVNSLIVANGKYTQFDKGNSKIEILNNAGT